MYNMSQQKDYRGFEEDGKKYKLDSKIFTIRTPSGLKLVEWRKKIFSEEITDVFERQKKGEELTKDILESCLENFSYEKELAEFHPKELEGAAGDLYIFLYEVGTERERSLLNGRLKAVK